MLALLFIAAPCVQGGFPGDDWPDDGGARAAARPDAVADLEDYAFTRVGKDSERKGIRTEGLLIIQGGQVVYERYFGTQNAHTRHIGWSVSKSVTSALVGTAVLAGQVTIEDSLCSHITAAWGVDCDITIRHLLEFSSGLEWAEVYENQSNQASSTLAMLYGEGRDDRSSFVASHRQAYDPGVHFSYSTGSTTLLAGVLQKSMAAAFGDEWPWAVLFDPLGMKETTFERDKVGRFGGGSYVWSTLRDFARFGYLYMKDGCWDGARILPDGWVAQSTQLTVPYIATFQAENATDDPPGESQGWQWWLNVVPDGGTAPLAWPDVPADAYAAEGHWGQYVLVVPSLDLIMVRTGDDRDGTLNENALYSKAIAVGRP